MENWIIGMQKQALPQHNLQLLSRAPACPNQSHPGSQTVDVFVGIECMKITTAQHSIVNV